LVVIASANPQFAADPTLAVFKKDIEGTFPLRRLFDGHFVASLYVQFVSWTRKQQSISAVTGEAALIQINHVRHWTLAANFALAQNYSFRVGVSPRVCRGRRAPVTGLVGK
jgi:hypothetical protein